MNGIPHIAWETASLRTSHAMPAASKMLWANPICALSGEERTCFIVKVTIPPNDRPQRCGANDVRVQTEAPSRHPLQAARFSPTLDITHITTNGIARAMTTTTTTQSQSSQYLCLAAITTANAQTPVAA